MFHYPLQSMWGISQSTPFWGPASSLAFVLFSIQCGTPPIHPFRGLASLLAHCLVSTPFGAQPPRWHIARCLALISFLTSSSPLLADIVLFELLLKVFKTRLLRRGFYTFIKNVLFSSLTDVGSHNEIKRFI